MSSCSCQFMPVLHHRLYFVCLSSKNLSTVAIAQLALQSSQQHKFAQNTSSCLEIHLGVLTLDPPKALQSSKNTKLLKIHLLALRYVSRVLILDPPKALQLIKQHKFAQSTSSCPETHLRVLTPDPPKALQFSKLVAKYIFLPRDTSSSLHPRPTEGLTIK